MKIDTSLFPLITVEWADHYSDFEGTYSRESVKELVKDICIRQTSGHLIEENKRQLVLASTVDFEDGEYSFCEVFVCMKKTIVARSDKPTNKGKIDARDDSNDSPPLY